MATTRIQEQTVTNALEGAGTNNIDQDHGVIRDVVICGFHSANNRKYPEETLRRDFRVYEGCKVNFNHSNDTRKFEDAAGWFSNVRPGSDGRPRGDLNVYMSDPRSPKIFEMAKRNPNGFGMSHVAMCHTRFEGGTEIVESIKSVESVDIVSDPATNAGLFESKQSKQGNRVAFTVKQLVEWMIKHPKASTAQIIKAKKLGEEDAGMYAGADMADAPAADADPDNAIMGGFKAAIVSLVQKALDGDMDHKEAMAKIKKLLAAHCDATETAASSDSGDAGGDEPSSEGKKKTPAAPDAGKRFSEAMALLEAAGLPLKSKLVNLVANASDSDRPELIATLKEGMKGTGGEPITGAGGRHQAARLDRTVEGNQSKDAPPTEGKKFAEWVAD